MNMQRFIYRLWKLPKVLWHYLRGDGLMINMMVAGPFNTVTSSSRTGTNTRAFVETCWFDCNTGGWRLYLGNYQQGEGQEGGVEVQSSNGLREV